VIDLRGRRERYYAVAVFADTSRRNVGRGLADRIDRVMAAGAVTGNVVMAEVRRDPPVSGVAVLAGVAAEDMAGILAGCDAAVMA